MKILNYFFYSFCILIIATSLWFKPKIFTVQSGSMTPSIKVGSIVATIPQKIYNTGDIITFKKDDKTITHRIMYIEDDKYLTAGDANEEFDLGSIKNNQIIGKVVFTIPHIGYIAGKTHDPKWFIFLVIVPATIIIYEELKFLFTQFKKTSPLEVPKSGILIPVIGAGIVLSATTASFFMDKEASGNNTLGASSNYGEQISDLYNSNEFTCSDGATNLSSPQAKLVVLKKSNGVVDVSVKLENATPLSTYDIWINQDPGGCPLAQPTEAGAIITDGSGNGTGDATLPEVVGATKFWVSVVGGGQVLRSVAISL